MARDVKTWLILHGETAAARLQSDGCCLILAPDLLPYGLYLEDAAGDVEAQVNNLQNFYAWCASRVLTLDRKWAKELLMSLGLRQAVTDRDRAEIALSYHALTLTDIDWVREENENVRFADVSLYRHSLSDALVDVALRGKPLTVQNAELLTQADTAGDLSTAGVAPKAWVRRDDTFWLLKDGDPRDVEAELLASQIARCFDVAQVLYERGSYEGEPVTRSKLMTSEEYSIVPASQVEIWAANHDTSVVQLALSLDPHGYHMMNIVDYLMGNTDRHWENWGFLVDNASNRLLRLHPLMDFNKAFLAYDTFEGARCQTTETVMSQRDAAITGVKAIGLNQIAEVQQAWFTDAWSMFEQRLNMLQKI